jgi:peptide deformylase
MSDIVVAPNQVLREPTKPVKTVDQRLLKIIDDLVSALKAAKNPQGVGLAAPQIGVSLRLFAIRPTPEDTPQIFINPEIISKSQRQQSPTAKNGVYEGCLSLPHFYSPLKRSMSVTVKYLSLLPNNNSQTTNHKQNSNSKPQKIKFENFEIENYLDLGIWNLELKQESYSGFPAHIIQHEMDHLNGVLFVDHVLIQETKLYHIEGKTWEEINL